METLFKEIEKLGSKKILDGPATLTYDELFKRCLQLHAFLEASGLRQGDRIGIAATDETEVAALILSCIRLGFPIAMIDSGAKKTEASEIIRRLGLKALFLDQELVDNWYAEIKDSVPFLWTVARQKKKLLHRLLGKKETDKASNQTYPDCLAGYEPSFNLPNFQERGAPALLLCTSGTTGLPKILQLSYLNLIAAARTTSSKLLFDSQVRVLNLLPLTHYDGIISGLFTAFFTSGTQIRLGAFTVSLLPDIFDAIYKYKATHVLLTPSILALMMRLGEEVEEAFRTEDFRFVVSVAATLPPKLWSDFEKKTGKKIVNVYGLSETGNNLFAGPDEESYRIGSIGKPVDCRAIIIDDAGEKVTVGKTGELLLDGASITSGYLGEPIATKAVDGTDWFATGDLALCDDSGVYWLVGRKKSIIIVGGRNVYPDEINNALLSHSSVVEAATVGVPDEIWGERVVSCVVAHQGGTPQNLTEHVAHLLADYKVPREIHLVPELPRGRSGKVLVNELVSRLVEGTLKRTEGGQQKIEDQVLRLASESFRVPRNELSPATTPQNCSRWDSVAHMDLVVNLEKTFGIELLPREVIRITTLEMAVHIVQEKLATK